MRQPLYILFAIFLMTSACKKEESTPHVVCGVSNSTSPINSQDLLNCKYIEGTYWVYIDSVNLQTDSLTVDSIDQGLIIESTCNNSYEHHTFHTTSHPSLDTEAYIIVAGGFYKNATTVNSGTQIYNGYSSTSAATDPAVNYLDSFYVFDQYYYDVSQFTVDFDVSEGNAQSVYYCNSDYGFLKHEIYENSALVSNKILKSKNIVR